MKIATGDCFPKFVTKDIYVKLEKLFNLLNTHLIYLFIFYANKRLAG